MTQLTRGLGKHYLGQQPWNIWIMDCEYVFFAEDLHISQVIFGVPCAKKPDFEIVHSGQDCHPHEMSLSEKRIGKTGRLIIILIFKTVLWAPFSDTYHMVPHNCTKNPVNFWCHVVCTHVSASNNPDMSLLDRRNGWAQLSARLLDSDRSDAAKV